MYDVENNMRQQGQATRERLLGSARQQFVTHGFKASSISAIAKQAGVTKSVVFHHFSCKAALWDAVKAALLKEMHFSGHQRADQQLSSVRKLVDYFLVDRIGLYDRQSDYFRMICWQFLDHDTFACETTTSQFIDQVNRAVSLLQKRRLIRSDHSAKTITAFLLSMLYGAQLSQSRLSLDAVEKKALITALHDQAMSYCHRDSVGN